MGRILFLPVLLAVVLSSCTAGRMIAFGFSDIKDYKRFPSRALQPSPEPFFFDRDEAKIAKGFPDLDSLVAHSKTVAFLIVHRDTLKYERYAQGYERDSWVASFSMAKSFTGALVGLAIEDGYIKSVEDKVVDYIPELRKQEGWEEVTIEHLLYMTSGAKHAENYFNPFAGVAKSYYGRRLDRQAKKVKLELKPGERFHYKSINTQLLGEVVTRATKRNLTDLLQEKIWTPIGMQYAASWSCDRRGEQGREKAFSSINATAIDFAKFGRLYMNGGKWEGKQVIPEAWVRKSTAYEEGVKGDVNGYQYQFWIQGEGIFTAEGHLGQFVYVNLPKNLLMVRLGKNYGKVSWYRIFKQIAAQTTA